MPLYEYKCQKCGEVFETIQRFSDEPLKTHNGCGGEVERLISTSALQFKGSGWYITDYAKGSGKSAPKTDGKSDSSAKSDTKSDTKSDSKSDSGTKTESTTSTTKDSSTK